MFLPVLEYSTAHLCCDTFVGVPPSTLNCLTCKTEIVCLSCSIRYDCLVIVSLGSLQHLRMASRSSGSLSPTLPQLGDLLAFFCASFLCFLFSQLLWLYTNVLDAIPRFLVVLPVATVQLLPPLCCPLLDDVRLRSFFPFLLVNRSHERAPIRSLSSLPFASSSSSSPFPQGPPGVHLRPCGS